MKKERFRSKCWKLFISFFSLFLLSSVMSVRADSTLESGKSYRIKVGGNNPSSNGTPEKVYLFDADGTAKCCALDETNDALVWTLTADTNEGYYQLCNKATGRYLPPLTDMNTAVTTKEEQQTVYLKMNTETGTTGEWFNILSSATSNISYNYYYANQIQGYYANDQKTNFLSGSEWSFERVYTPEDITPSADYVTPQFDGTTVYRIFSQKNSSALEASGKVIYETDGTLNSLDESDRSNYASYWRLVALEEGKTAIQNLLTGRYVQLRNQKDLCYTTGLSDDGFTISENSNAEGFYNIIENDDLGLNFTDQNGGAIYSWTPFNGSKDRNSLWRFKSYDIPEKLLSEIDEKREGYYIPLSNAKIRIKTVRSASGQANRYITDRTGEQHSTTMENALSGEEANRQVWVLIERGNGYVLRNYATGNYLNYTETSGACTFYIRQNPNQKGWIQIGEKSDFTGNGLHYKKQDHTVVSWAVNTQDEGGVGSNWTFENVELTDAEVLDRFCSIDGTYKSVEDGVSGFFRLVRLWGQSNNQSIS